MLNVSFSQPVNWASNPPPEIAPVAPVSAVAPTGGRSREGQSNLGARDDARPATPRKGAEKNGPELQAAPLLPHKKIQDGQRAGGVPGEPDAVEQREREALAQAAEKAAQKPQLQEVLSSVWKASAAVIDVVLGREAAASAALANETKSQSSVTEIQQGSAAALKKKNTETGLLPGSTPSDLEQGEPVAYTEQGTSTWAALETGSLVNRKV